MLRPSTHCSSLKSTWAISERDLLTSFRVCALGAAICRNFLQEQKCWQAPFFLPSFNLAGLILVATSSDTIYPASTAPHALVFCRFALPNPPALAGTSPKWCQTWQAASLGTSTPQGVYYPTVPGRQPQPEPVHLQSNSCTRKEGRPAPSPTHTQHACNSHSLASQPAPTVVLAGHFSQLGQGQLCPPMCPQQSLPSHHKIV